MLVDETQMKKMPRAMPKSGATKMKMSVLTQPWAMMTPGPALTMAAPA